MSVDFILEDEPEEYQPTPKAEPSRYVVAIYELDRHYGGAEEGGWWYNTGSLVRVLKIFRDRNKAAAYNARVQHWLDKVVKAGGYRANLSSMAYSGGAYQSRICDETAPKEWSDYQPWE